MKWGIVILLILGIVAAVCAALLVGMMGGGSSAAAKNSEGLEVVVAKRSMPAMTVVMVEDFVKQKVARNELPQGQQVASPTRVVGRVLAVPVVEGQVLSESCFIADGTGAQLAAALPKGMRAFTVNLNSRAIPDQILLYPGCVVDVLFSSKLGGRDARGEALSTTILQGIQVLAVQGESVVSKPATEESDEAKTRTRSGGLQVTLLVDEQQAKALQLACDNGNISLAVRNPLDKSFGGTEAMVLNQGRLATSGSAMEPEALAAAQKNSQKDEKSWVESQIVTGGDPNGQPQPSMDQWSQAPKRPRWGVTVIRGRETKTEEFAVSGSEPNEPSEGK